MLISIETYRICDFPVGGSEPPIAPGSAHAYDRSTCDIQIFKPSVKPNPRDRFSHAMARATSDASKHDSGYFTWFYNEHRGL